MFNILEESLESAAKHYKKVEESSSSPICPLCNNRFSFPSIVEHLSLCLQKREKSLAYQHSTKNNNLEKKQIPITSCLSSYKTESFSDWSYAETDNDNDDEKINIGKDEYSEWSFVEKGSVFVNENYSSSKDEYSEWSFTENDKSTLTSEEVSDTEKIVIPKTPSGSIKPILTKTIKREDDYIKSARDFQKNLVRPEKPIIEMYPTTASDMERNKKGLLLLLSDSQEKSKFQNWAFGKPSYYALENLLSVLEVIEGFEQTDTEAIEKVLAKKIASVVWDSIREYCDIPIKVERKVIDQLLRREFNCETFRPVKDYAIDILSNSRIVQEYLNLYELTQSISLLEKKLKLKGSKRISAKSKKFKFKKASSPNSLSPPMASMGSMSSSNSGSNNDSVEKAVRSNRSFGDLQNYKINLKIERQRSKSFNRAISIQQESKTNQIQNPAAKRIEGKQQTLTTATENATRPTRSSSMPGTPKTFKPSRKATLTDTRVESTEPPKLDSTPISLIKNEEHILLKKKRSNSSPEKKHVRKKSDQQEYLSKKGQSISIKNIVVIPQEKKTESIKQMLPEYKKSLSVPNFEKLKIQEGIDRSKKKPMITKSLLKVANVDYNPGYTKSNDSPEKRERYNTPIPQSQPKFSID